jgi:hypothetical protein
MSCQVKGHVNHTGPESITIAGAVTTETRPMDYNNDATAIVNTLRHLPSGTWTRVLRGMLEQEISDRDEMNQSMTPLQAAWVWLNRTIHDTTPTERYEQK